MLDRAMKVRRQYADLEQYRHGRSWTRAELLQGFVGDVGDLVKLAMACDGIRHIPDAHHRMAHELADCLWSILVLSELYEIDLQQAFLQTMHDLEEYIASESPD